MVSCIGLGCYRSVHLDSFQQHRLQYRCYSSFDGGYRIDYRCYSLCYGWMPFSLEIDQTFIGAILTAIGYSINDKVVIFDRVREFIGLYPKRDRTQLFNDSLNTTLARTINTSLSTLIVLLSIFILGGDSIRSFAFAMILGVVIGTLSSLFVAAPVAYLTMGHKMPKQAGEAE